MRVPEFTYEKGYADGQGDKLLAMRWWICWYDNNPYGEGYRAGWESISWDQVAEHNKGLRQRDPRQATEPVYDQVYKEFMKEAEHS